MTLRTKRGRKKGKLLSGGGLWVEPLFTDDSDM